MARIRQEVEPAQSWWRSFAFDRWLIPTLSVGIVAASLFIAFAPTSGGDSSAPDEVQLRRLVLRDRTDEAAARARVAAQMPLAEKRHRATWVIDNGGTPEETAAQVDAWWRRWVRQL